MSDINLTKAVRQNLLSLQNTAKLMATTQSRLSTGNKVNSALDNPSNFFTASSLNARAGELDSLLDSMNNGVKTLEAADNGLTSITNTLESMQSTLRQARQDKSFQTASYNVTTLDPAGAGKLTFQGGAFAGATNYGLTTQGSGQYAKTTVGYAAPAAKAQSVLTSDSSINLTTGAVAGGTLTLNYRGKSVNIAITGHGAGNNLAAVQTDIANGLVGTALDGLVNVTTTATGITLTAVNQEDGQVTVTDDTGGTADSLFGTGAAMKVGAAGSNGLTEFTINGKSYSLDTTTGANLTTAVATLNSKMQTDGLKFQAYDDGSGKLGVRATTTDAGALAIGGVDAGLFGTPDSFGLVAGTQSANLTLVKTVDDMVSEINNDSTLKTKVKASNDNGKLRIQNLSTQDLSITGVNSSGKLTGSSADQSSIDGNSVRSGLADQFNVLRDQLDKLADDASFNGINLLRGDKLKITFNETGTSSIDIQVPGGKSIDTTQLGLPTTMLAQDLDADTSIDGLLDKVKAALNQVRSQSSTFGSNLSVVENRQDFTKKMMNTLQTGGSNLTLADMNEEAANMVALQTRQSLATSSLSMANQADQNVLQLLRG